MRIFEVASHAPWAITEEMLRTILQIAARENTADMIETARAMREDRIQRQAVMFRDGRPLDNTKSVVVRDGVAILAVEGPIFRRADMLTEMSGATSVDAIARDFAAALDAPTVNAILLTIDSPGGEAAGINELASTIFAARGQKPITAYVDGIGASAAYWLASAADAIVVDSMALVGSIGVVMAVPDPTKTNTRDITFVSSQSPNKRPNPTTEQGKTGLQALVDDMGSVFINAVALHRGVSTDTVLSDFGQGGLFVGQAAVAAGLADRIGSFESVLSSLQSQTHLLGRSGASTEESRMAAKEPTVEATEPATGETVKLVAEANDELTRLRAALAEERAKRITSEAEQFYTAHLAASKVTPGEKTALIDAYTTLASEMPDRGPTLLTTLLAARPKHGLTEELMPARDTLATLYQRTATPGANDNDADEAREQARVWAEKQNGHRKGVN